MAVLAEACAFAERLGIDAAQILAALAGGRADSRQLQEMFPKMVGSEFSNTGRAALMVKDLDLIENLARDVGSPIPVTTVVAGLFCRMAADGLADRDNTEMVTGSFVRLCRASELGRRDGPEVSARAGRPAARTS
ncbi:MAG: NAD-binding protein [Vicinamibacterales bacterium]